MPVQHDLIWEADSNYSLLQGIHEAAARVSSIPSQHQGAADQKALAARCESLGLGIAAGDGALVHRWEIDSRSVDDLPGFPSKLPHAGRYQPIGQVSNERPKWLWDARKSETVLASQHEIDEGYVAVSYTWGRWQDGTSRQLGTLWEIPTTNCDFDLAELKHVLSRIRQTRYFWVDVLCINQEDEDELRQEIAKQGAIFGAAESVLVYLWTLKTTDSLAYALGHLGEQLLWWLRLAEPSHKEKARYKAPTIEPDEIAKHSDALRSDHWFSSLWTLQEMILAPASLWLTKDGHCCTVNGRLVSTHFVASAVQTLISLPAMQERLLSRMAHIHKGTHQTKWVEAAKQANAGRMPSVSAWGKWAARYSSITSCLTASRASILLAGSRREARKWRGLAVLAALKVQYDKAFENDSGLEAGQLPVALTSTVMQAEGGAIFACMHGGQPLTSMLPTTANACHFIDPTDFDSLPCVGGNKTWTVCTDGSITICKDSIMQKMRSGRAVLWMNGGVKLDTEMKQSKDKIKEYLGDRNIHVKFLPIAVRKHGALMSMPFQHMLLENIQGVILVASKQKPPADQVVRWHKAGMYNADSFHAYNLSKDIIVRGNFEQ